ncbi:MAG: caspase family protein, partial [Geminicoccaceae bacterium]
MCRPIFVVGCMAFALLGQFIGALPASAASSLFSKSHALIIGIGRYDSNAWPSLDYAKKDARAMASFLKDQGYEVRTLLDSQATRVRILRELSDYLENRLEPNDRFVFFFSGHGETKERSGRDFGYIVPHDGGDDVGNWISMAELRDISRQLDKARHQLFLLDSCYGGEFAVKGMLSSISERDHPNYVEAISRNKARQFITAGGKGERVRADGPDGYSYFTGYLLKALKGAADANGDGYVTAS